MVALASGSGLPTAADGRPYPLVPADPATTAALLTRVEEALRSPATPEADLPALGHQQQVIYRALAHQKHQATLVRAALPEPWGPVNGKPCGARRTKTMVFGQRFFFSKNTPPG